MSKSLETGLAQQIIEAVARVAEIIVGLLVLLPFMRSDQQQTSAGGERAGELRQDARGLADVLQRDDVERGVEDGVAKRQRGEIADNVELANNPRPASPTARSRPM